jgi:hypothetical protein
MKKGKIFPVLYLASFRETYVLAGAVESESESEGILGGVGRNF